MVVEGSWIQGSVHHAFLVGPGWDGLGAAAGPMLAGMVEASVARDQPWGLEARSRRQCEIPRCPRLVFLTLGSLQVTAQLHVPGTSVTSGPASTAGTAGIGLS